MLTLDRKSATQADAISSAIKEPGKYIGIITRAEALKSKNGTPGVGLSFKSDSGESADYLDLYLGETDGKPWHSSNTANAILACLKLNNAALGKVKFERWNKETSQREVITVDGYPDIQGKRIGFLFQPELSTYNGQTKEKLNIFGVFHAESEMTASEIIGKATKPEKLEQLVRALALKPVKDSRTNKSSPISSHQGQPEQGQSFSNSDPFSDDTPF